MVTIGLIKLLFCVNIYLIFIKYLEKTIMDRNQIITQAEYEHYKEIVNKRKKKMKPINIVFPISTGVSLLYVSGLSVAFDGAIWALSLFCIPIILVLTWIILIIAIFGTCRKERNAIDDYDKFQEEERKHIEENLRKQQQQNAKDAMTKLDQIKKTVIVETHTSKDSADAMNRGVVGAVLFGATGAVVGTATAEEKTYTTFLIIYNDDSRQTQCVENESALYNHYIKYLDV